MKRLSRVALGAALIGLFVLTPPPAQAANVGAGEMIGSVSFAGSGLPPIGQQCRPVSFTLTGAAQIAVAFNTVIDGYAGPISVVPGTGIGSSACETTSLGGGSLAMTVHGDGPTGSQIDCTLAGAYTRVATHVTVVLGGPCKINNRQFEAATFVAVAEFTPTGANGGNIPGVNANITAANFTAAFTIAPA